MSRRTINTIIAVLIVLSGVVLFNYPTIATFVNDLTANRDVVEYQEQMNSLEDEELQREMELAFAYNASLPMSFPADPFSGGNINTFEGSEFEDFDLVQPGAMVGYLEIPKIDIYLPVLYGTGDEVLDKNLGLIENTSLPVGGAGTHAAISGHTGMATRKLFTDLNRMEEGDLFFVHVLNQHFAYKVDQVKVVLPEETEDLVIEKERDYVTLVTCTPFGINDHRLLVRGAREPYDFTTQKKDIVLQRRDYTRRWILAGLAAALFMLLVFVKIHRDRRDSRNTEAEAEADEHRQESGST